MNIIRVLIVEDEKLLCELIRDFLEDKGFKMEIALTGRDGHNLLLKESFDAVIVDLRLTDMTGNDFILKADKIRPGMKFIIYTGLLDFQVPPELEAIGMDKDSFLLKPVYDLNDIYNKIMTKLKANIN